MPTFLSDPSPTVYLLLLVVAVVTAGVWFRNRTRKTAIAAVIGVALLVLLILCDRLVESPREEAARRLNLMAVAATASDGSRFVEHVSSSFSYSGANKDRLRTSGVWSLIQQHNATVTVSGFSKDDAEYPSPDTVVVGFMAKGQVPSGEFVLRYVKATFVRDKDGAFRIQTMKFFDPINTKNEDPIPGFP